MHANPDVGGSNDAAVSSDTLPPAAPPTQATLSRLTQIAIGQFSFVQRRRPLRFGFEAASRQERKLDVRSNRVLALYLPPVEAVSGTSPKAQNGSAALARCNV